MARDIPLIAAHIASLAWFYPPLPLAWPALESWYLLLIHSSPMHVKIVLGHGEFFVTVDTGVKVVRLEICSFSNSLQFATAHRKVVAVSSSLCRKFIAAIKFKFSGEQPERRCWFIPIVLRPFHSCCSSSYSASTLRPLGGNSLQDLFFSES